MVLYIESNDIRTKFPTFPPDEKERLYHEFAYIAIDKSLFNEDSLIKCFREVIKYTINIDKQKEEVFWTAKFDTPISRIIDCGVLYNVKGKYEYEEKYYFIQEASCFFKEIMRLEQRQEELKRIYNM